MLEATCSIDISYFPFDTQTCELKFVAWSYTKSDVNLDIGTKGILLDEYIPNSQWDIMSTTTKETNTIDSSVIFSVTMKRKSSFYVLNIILPVILLTILNCFTFMLPVVSGERAGYGITVFLSLAVFLTIVASELPKNSDKTSWLAIYLMAMTTLSTVIVIICLIQIRISTRTLEERPISKPYLLLYKVYQVLQCKTCDRKRVSSADARQMNGAKGKPIFVREQENYDKNKQNKETADKTSCDEITWIHIVNAIDFLALCICILITFLFTVIFLAVSTANS